MFIQTENTPNPAVIKFLPGQVILEEGSADFRSVEDSVNSPLARRLFGLQGVRGVFFGHDFVSVTKADDTDWSMLKPMVLATLMEHLSTGQQIMSGAAHGAGDADDAGDDDEISVQIKELIAERVRPMVMMDGGDIAFDRFDHSEGVVYLEMRGACSGCPSATATLKSGIENMLKHFIPEVREVRPVTQEV